MVKKTEPPVGHCMWPEAEVSTVTLTSCPSQQRRAYHRIIYKLRTRDVLSVDFNTQIAAFKQHTAIWNLWHIFSDYSKYWIYMKSNILPRNIKLSNYSLCFHHLHIRSCVHNTPPKYTKNDQMILENQWKKTSNNVHISCLFPPPSNQRTKNSFWLDFYYLKIIAKISDHSVWGDSVRRHPAV